MIEVENLHIREWRMIKLYLASEQSATSVVELKSQ